MRRKAWLFVIVALIIFAQLTVLTSMFHPIQAQGSAYGNSIVEIAKMNYVSGWVSVTISSAFSASQNGTVARLHPTIQFPNGSQVIVNSSYSFQIKLPRTGDCFCSGGTSLFGTNATLDTSNPVIATIVTNASNFLIGNMPKSGSEIGSVFQYEYYWFIVQGYGLVSINGESVAY